MFARAQESNPEHPPSRLSRALRVQGLVEMDGELTVDGTVLGRINALRVHLSAQSHVEGDVVAREVRIEGRFSGRVFAQHVTIESSANITGRIFHNTISVAQGARIDGRMPWRPPSYFLTLTQLPEIRL